jgi:hypothetical protein
MSDHAFDFLESWIVENIQAKMFEDKVERLAQDCVWEAQTRGILPERFRGHVIKGGEHQRR